MTHHMNLVPSAFQAVLAGEKTVEMRLYDEKRASIQIGDEIEFENTVTHRTIKCLVRNLTRYKDFFELYSNFDKTAIGYGENETADAADMYAFYAPEQIETHGVLAIGIEVISSSI